MGVMAKLPAIFLDRDGTLIEDRGHIRDCSEVRFYPFTTEALTILKDSFLLFIITNQSGIGKGLVREEEVSAIHAHILDSLSQEGIEIREVYSCPHRTEDNCACKKPKTAWVEKACREYPVDPGRSYIIGDHPSDAECGLNAGMTPIYLLTGHGTKHLPELTQETIICDNLLSAAKYINSVNK